MAKTRTIAKNATKKYAFFLSALILTYYCCHSFDDYKMFEVIFIDLRSLSVTFSIEKKTLILKTLSFYQTE